MTFSHVRNPLETLRSLQRFQNGAGIQSAAARAGGHDRLQGDAHASESGDLVIHVR